MSFKCDEERDWLDAQRYAIFSGYTWKIFALPKEPIDKPDNMEYPMYLFMNPGDMSLEYDNSYSNTDEKEFGYVLFDYSNYIRQYKIHKIF